MSRIYVKIIKIKKIIFINIHEQTSNFFFLHINCIINEKEIVNVPIKTYNIILLLCQN
jgi:hypothetical protein